MIAGLFVAAAVVGSLLRAAATSFDRFNRALLGTLLVNVCGAFLLGLLTTSGASTQVVLGVGGLGALTTFSSFVSQIECIDREGRRRDAVAYTAATLLFGIGAAWVGIGLT